MNSCPLSSILIAPNRQRQEFDPDALMELMTSIQQNGLFHPIVVRETRPHDGTFTLVAGERRLRAVQDLWALGGTLRHNDKAIPQGSVPYVTLGALPRLEAEEAELDENLKRRDLTWQEHASAVQRLHLLRQEQAALRGDTHVVADTALEVRGSAEGSQQAATRKEILVAAHLANPEVAKAKSVDEAFKILKQNETRERNIQLATAVGATFGAHAHSLLQGDCLKLMAVPNFLNRFDCILTDPPYGMNAQEFGDGAGRFTAASGIDHRYDDSPEAWRALLGAWAPLSFACAKEKAHAYVFCDFERFAELKQMMEAAGWYVFRTPFIVHKVNSGRVPLPENGPRRQWEMLLYAIKGWRPVTKIYPDVIPCTADDQMQHGAQKPVELFHNLLMRSCNAGDSVLDSFAGSGTIFPAAHQLKVAATGMEMSQEYYGIGLGRMKGLK